MAPINPHIISQLRQLIYYHLDCNLLRNALFFAGRLHAYEPRSSEAAYLLALCHLKLGQLKAAYDSSRNSGSRGTHLGCSYVFAQACLGLQRYMEGISALERSKGLWSIRSSWGKDDSIVGVHGRLAEISAPGKHTESRRQNLPDAAAVWCLLGKIWQAHSEHQKSIESYAEALKINPYMWDAFTSLCDLGANVRTSNIFKITPEMMSSISDPSHAQTPLGTLDESPPNALSQSDVNLHVTSQLPAINDPFSTSKIKLNGEMRNNVSNSALYEKVTNGNVVTPSGAPDFIGEDTPPGNGGIMDPAFFSGKEFGNEPPLAPMRKGRGLPGMGLGFGSDAPPKMRSSATLSSKSKSNIRPEDQEESTVSRSSTANSGGPELKRTVSGKTAHGGTAAPKPTSAVDTEPGVPQRKSVRLLNQFRPNATRSIKEDRELRKVKAPSTKGRSANTFNVGRVVSGNRKHGDPMDVDGKEQRLPTSNYANAQTVNPKPVINERARELEAMQWLAELFRKLGSAYFSLSHYKCQEAIQVFQTVIPSQRDTPWVLAQIGRAYYEQASYAEAEKIFTRLRTIAPSRLEEMEFYSTSLWHLKNDVDLAFLSHELIDLDRQSPQAWCAVGNSFSLQRDHDQAIKCFKRATQLEPTFAYAYTLQGHEHLSNEEYDKAMSAFRASITAENRHYNAWYGLGRVFEKQGKWPQAEQHYRTAHDINKNNAVLITCIGVMLEKQKNLRAALAQYTKACQLSEKGTLWRFKKAKALVTLGQPEKALIELRLLKDIAPDEANVYFSLGNVYKKLRQKGEAIRHFTMALNLDPKASHLIKEAMEELDNSSEDEDMNI